MRILFFLALLSANIESMANLTMQEALQINSLFQKSEKIYQYANLEQMKRRFTKSIDSLLEEEILKVELKPAEIFLPSDQV
jgi:hypothetical protein